MCAAPALARAATIHDKKTPFREVQVVLAIEVSAELAELSLRLKTVDTVSFDIH